MEQVTSSCSKTEQDKAEDKEHLNLFFSGHVDAGKSTLIKCMLFYPILQQLGIRYLDFQDRPVPEGGKFGLGDFETDHKRFTILEPLSFKSYSPQKLMQADSHILVISARKGEFESGIEKGGQTAEHIRSLASFGCNELIVVINKMDTVHWSKERYDDIVSRVSSLVLRVGIAEVFFIPICTPLALNIYHRLEVSDCSWYDGPCLFEYLDSLKPTLLFLRPLRVTIIDSHTCDGGMALYGKIESGRIREGEDLILVPGDIKCRVHSIFINDASESIESARSGENVKLTMEIDETKTNVHKGMILCTLDHPISCQTKFKVQLSLFDLLPHRPIVSNGFTGVIHIHSAAEEFTILALIEELNKETGEVIKKRPRFVKSGAVVTCVIECAKPVPIELFSESSQLGRFAVRDEGKMIALGKIIALKPQKQIV